MTVTRSRAFSRLLIFACAAGLATVDLSAQALPPGWTHGDIGNVQARGAASYDGSSFTVTGSGADVWGTSDELHWAYTTISGNFAITARVDSVEDIHRWTKAGLMIRSGIASNAAHGSLFATPTTEKGIAFQRRDSAGRESASTAGPAYAPPVWLKLVRRTSTITAYYRQNRTDVWTPLGYQPTTGISADGPLQVGLAVSSHVDGLRATARFSEVTVEGIQDWSFTQIGSSGSIASTDSTLFGVGGKGADIWNKVDAFAGFWVPWTGDGTITTRVWQIDNTHRSAKAGVMFRESLTRSSRHVMNIVTAGRGIAVQYRPTTGENTVASAYLPGAAPVWLRLTRAGDVFTGTSSTDGVTWLPVFTVSQPLNAQVWVGMVHTSHDATVPGWAAFDDVTLRR